MMMDFLRELLKNIIYKSMPDRHLLRIKYKRILNEKLNLENPTIFSEKIQWLKLHWYDPLATLCADKFEVRKFVRDRIGEHYLNELYSVYNSVDEIVLEELPNSFVMKCTHGSGFNIICRNKTDLDWNKESKKIRRWLKRNYYLANREWVYKDIKPRIICERLLIEDEVQGALTDYKFFCFHGEVKFCQVIRGRGVNETIDFYDEKWERLPFVGLRELPNSSKVYPKPEKYEEMMHLAKVLSEDFPFVRVDFYYVEGRIYFGEMTFFPKSGFGSFYPKIWNRTIGDMLQLDKVIVSR